MKKNIIITILAIIAIPLLVVIIFLFTSVKVSNNTDTAEGESYLAELDKVQVADVELKIREQNQTETVTSEAVTDAETEAPTEPVTDVPTEPESTVENVTVPPTEPATEPVTTPAETAPPISGDVQPVSGTTESGFVYSAIGSYNPYSFDATEAQATADGLANGTISYQVLFADSAFVGDSVMDGFDCYMKFNHTFTKVGASMASHLPTVIDGVISTYPKCIFVRYGINEMGTTDLEATNFANTYKTYIQRLRDSLPGTKIVVIGLTPVGPAAIARDSRFSNVAMYNAKIKSFCIELGVAYYENSSLFLAHPELYSTDGIHLQKTMYEIWLRDMVAGLGTY